MPANLLFRSEIHRGIAIIAHLVREFSKRLARLQSEIHNRLCYANLRILKAGQLSATDCRRSLQRNVLCIKAGCPALQILVGMEMAGRPAHLTKRPRDLVEYSCGCWALALRVEERQSGVETGAWVIYTVLTAINPRLT